MVKRVDLVLLPFLAGQKSKHIGIVLILKVQEECFTTMETISKEITNYHRNKELASTNGMTLNTKDSSKKISCKVMPA